MSDISMCLGNNCKKKMKCYRFTAPKNPYRQSMIFVNDERTEKCDMFWDNKGYNKDESFSDKNSKTKNRSCC